MSVANSLARAHVHPGLDEALASVAHEMRLPLSHIKGFTSALRRDDVEWDTETRQDFLAGIELQADRLTEIVESLMDTARPAQLRPSSGTDTDLTLPVTVVDGALHRVRGLLADRVVRRNVAADLPPVPVNVGQMERVLANLLQNAVKYTPVGTEIDVSARVTGDTELELVVADRGPGVPAAHHQDIFQPFFRSHVDGAAVPGHGLGLAICQSIVLAHGGRMSVTDRPGGGASFSVFLPLQASKEKAHDPANDSRRRRRSADAQTSVGQSESQRLQRSRGSGWDRGPEADRRAPDRSAAA